ncbi:NAD(P)H-hydrate dehydratase [Sandarakinorhabdus sp. DWP1-3-1]|uniref:NAD(P)H-hydrate dehydratase n=1 Tax=Sandarakinorhabdus sp. DWP1-3-1 TaxID=2804627 RepID=UPI003CF23FCC
MLIPAPGLPLPTPGEMRAAEQRAIADGTPALVLMERAAAAAALATRRYAPRREVLVLCGPGNNGGDGYGVALLLQAAGVMVRVAASGPPRSQPAATMAARWTGPIEALASAAPAPVIVDALYGTGVARPLDDETQATLDRLRCAGAAVVALDIPSGVDGATGAMLGRPLPADLTVAFGAMKRGHAIGAGRLLSGRVVIADIGIAVPSSTVLVQQATLALPADTHKYQRGAVLVIRGTAPGAARLAALAALRAGAGLVTLVGPDAGVPADAIMQRDDAAGLALLADPRTGAIAIGPGLADDQRSRDWLLQALAGEAPVVIDAGALGLAGDPARFAAGRVSLVLTPHEGEFTRLFGPPGSDRIAAVQAAANVADAVVLLKGAETIIAAPDGRVAVNTHAAPWLATAGSGDVLTGIIAALLASGLSPFDAATTGAWLHGDAGIRGGAGLIADDIPGLLSAVLGAL